MGEKWKYFFESIVRLFFWIKWTYHGIGCTCMFWEFVLRERVLLLNVGRTFLNYRENFKNRKKVWVGLIYLVKKVNHLMICFVFCFVCWHRLYMHVLGICFCFVCWHRLYMHVLGICFTIHVELYCVEWGGFFFWCRFRRAVFFLLPRFSLMDNG